MHLFRCALAGLHGGVELAALHRGHHGVFAREKTVPFRSASMPHTVVAYAIGRYEYEPNDHGLVRQASRVLSPVQAAMRPGSSFSASVGKAKVLASGVATVNCPIVFVGP